ncbi:malectin domain-containing carbohydrate-binding protein [Pelagicoccus sp. SDUM812002]|uniref:malectin domain-containing carbohydrate-binding protein n=1 Tax=Pelagicoccus sp. SDUM812002 TaxID=3041266 RepID=UPI00280FC3CF|nr:malectin domain-containing carbohydrate-binding protein [Pelagicoccus sp. SDUM812002]MDQ8188179.1 malectin domain-containing carbohydrate-binding protein [Pelagicoccus sp. SDUM812002]
MNVSTFSELPNWRALKVYFSKAFVAVCLLAVTCPSIEAVDFSSSRLQGLTFAPQSTTLEFGPDGRLYVGYMGGLIKIYTVVRNGPNDYQAVTSETIQLVRGIPNFSDNGVYEPETIGRQLTGILVRGTASNPIIYVTSNDPREGSGAGGFNGKNLDTNSGVVSKLEFDGEEWSKVDLVRGLPRSQENHALSGLDIDEENNIIYFTVGGNTNAGGPSINFAFLPETAYSGTIGTIDLTAVEAMPIQVDAYGQSYHYNMPTLDDPDPTRPHELDGSDVNDPFGGNDGLNQAKIEADSPVQLYATGFRNPYDLIISDFPGREGKIYTWDNAGNPGWGGYPANEGPSGLATNEYILGEPGFLNNQDNFHLVSPGYYGGHPNPIRANPAGAGWVLFDPSAPSGEQAEFVASPTSDWPPVPVEMANPVEGDFLLQGTVENPDLLTNNSSTNGLDEYLAGNFNGEMAGDIIAAGMKGHLLRIKLNEDGTEVVNGREELASNFAANPLDVTIPNLLQAPSLYGTIWVACYDVGTTNIVILEPADFDDPGNSVCTGFDSFEIDEDGDGYSNGDEIANGTDPCSGAQVPPDYDGDFISDLMDEDDDNDGLWDTEDAFQRDPHNGMSTAIPMSLSLFNTNTGFFSVGVTGMMVNPGDDYLGQYDPFNIVAGGTAGLFSISQVDAGTAKGSANNQVDAYIFGVPSSDLVAPYLIRVSIAGPFFGGSTNIEGQQSQGFFIGTGDQDNYLKVAVNANDGEGGIEILYEDGGGVLVDSIEAFSGFLSNSTMDLFMYVDPVSGYVQPMVQRESDPEATVIGSPIFLQGNVLAAVSEPGPLAIGLIATTGDPATATFSPTWDLFEITVPDLGASAEVVIDPEAGSIVTSSTYIPGSFRVENTSSGGQKIASVKFDLTRSLMPNTVFDSEGTAGDTAFKAFDLNLDDGIDSVVATFVDSHNLVDGDDGYDGLLVEATGFDVGESLWFSTDVDPNSIKGVIDPGPNDSGSVSGLEVIGTKVTVGFDDGTILKTRVSRRDQSNRGSTGSLVFERPVQPYLQVVGAEAPLLTVEDPTIRVVGPAGTSVTLVQMEAGLYLDGVAGGGYNLSAFESNTVLSVQEYTGVIDANGELDFDVTLLLGDAESGGINLFSAYLTDESGVKGPASDTLVVEVDKAALNDDEEPTQPPGFQANGTLANSSQLVWAASTDNFEVTGYNIYVDGVFLISVGSPGYVLTGLDPFTTYLVEVTAVDQAGNESSRSSKLLTTQSEPGTTETVLRVNAGGGAFTDTDENEWLADTGFNVGNVYSQSVAIEGTANDALYQTERWDPPSAPELSYAFALANGAYEIRIHLAEISTQVNSAGQRVFGIAVEGETVETAIDIFAATGSARALILTYPATVSDGQLNVSFIHGIENPKVSAIEVLRPLEPFVDDTPPAAPETFTATGLDHSSIELTWSAASDDVGVVSYAVSRDGAPVGETSSLTYLDEGLDPEATYDYEVTALDAAGNESEPALASGVTLAEPDFETVLRVNAGGPIYTDGTGAVWSADFGFNTGSAYSNGVAIAGTTDDPLYQTERWDAGAAPELQYSFALADGDYLVRLHFAEIYSGIVASGQRVFGIVVEGSTVDASFDIFDTAGFGTAHVVEVPATVVGGSLEIGLLHATENPKVNAIEVLRPLDSFVDDTPPSPPGSFAATGVDHSSVELTWTAASDDVGVVSYAVYRDGSLLAEISSLAYLDEGLDPQTSYNYEVTAFDAAGNESAPALASGSTLAAPDFESMLRVNAGGPAYTDGSGAVWSADFGFNTGSSYSNGVAIAGTTDDALYQTERWDAGAAPELQYSFALADGDYLVRLHFAEIYNGIVASGQRVFGIVVEGSTFDASFDIFEAAGFGTSHVVEVQATVVGGSLEIDFLHVTENPKVNAIEVLRPSEPFVDDTPPAAPATFTATGLDESSIGLAWTAASDNVGVVSYAVYREGSLLVETSELTYLDEGLDPETSYDYEVTAFDSTGNESAPALASSVTLAGPDDTPPAVPGSFIATGIDHNSIELTWSSASDNVGVSSYAVYRGGSLLGETSGLTYLDEGLDPETSYDYEVTAFDAAGNESAPALASGATLAEPDFESVLRVNVGGPAYTDGSGAVWSADVGFNTGGTFSRNIAIAGTTDDTLYQTERWDGGAAPELHYSFALPNGSYQVRLHFAEIFAGIVSPGQRVMGVQIEGAPAAAAIDIFGAVGSAAALVLEFPATVSDGELNIVFLHVVDNTKVNAIEVLRSLEPLVDDTPPDAPETFTATGLDDSSIQLTWSAASDEVGVVSYAVYRGGSLVSETASLTYLDEGLDPEASYDYEVTAFDAAGNESAPALTSGTTLDGPDDTPPDAPETFTATGLDDSSIQLTWSAASDEVGVVSYAVYRGGSLLGETASLTYLDEGLDPETSYDYEVTAFDAAGNESAPALTSGATLAAPDFESVLRVNVGGPAYTDGSGLVWSADFGFKTGGTYSRNIAIAGTTDDTLYQTERWDGGAAPELQYAFALEDGSYLVRLHFAEIFAGITSSGQRVMGVQIEGAPAAAAIDIFGTVGGAAALVLEFPVTVSDGELNIVLLHVVDNTKVNAIEVLKAL